MRSGNSGPVQEAQGHAMKIYFCDICNESIPLKDINSNRITIEEGKIFCQKCAPKKPNPMERIPGPMLAVVLLLISGGTVLAIYGWKITSDLDLGQREIKASVASIRDRLPVLEGQIQGQARSVADVLPRVNRLAEDLSTARAELQQRFNDLDRREGGNHEAQAKALQQGLEALAGRLENEVAEIRKQTQDIKVEFEGHKVSVGGLKDQVALLKDMVTAREPAAPAPQVRPGEAPSGVGPEAGAPSPPAAAPDKTALEKNEVNTLIAQLKDTDPGKRYSAIIELGRYTGPTVVKALEGMLADSEDYVRVAAIQNLRKLGSIPSIVMIIGALRDRDYFVRVAAHNALRSLTGAELNFDPDGSPSERESRVKEWEKWWEANKDRLLKGA